MHFISTKYPLINTNSADKDRELGDAQAEIKALKLTERAREKAFEEVLNSFIFSLCLSREFCVEILRRQVICKE